MPTCETGEDVGAHLAAILEAQPQGEISTSLGMLGIRQSNSALSRPVKTSADFANSSTEDDEPLSAISIVLVQGGAVDRPPKGASDECPLDADPVDEDRRHDAEKTHEAKDK